MNLVPVLLDLGNIIFFIATFPQLKLTYQNRNNLKDLSKFAFLLYSLAVICFIIVAVITKAYITFILGVFQIITFILTAYWVWRCENERTR